MEAFGTDYTVHNLPLLLLSGLDVRDRSHSDASPPKQALLHEGGFRLRNDLPPLDSPLAESLRDVFQNHDGSEALWRLQSPSPSNLKLFRIKYVGRVGQAP
jgi:trafficking protein particle complex subunit 11